jgi:N-sulfoglucosamine sulfohydrolase
MNYRNSFLAGAIMTLVPSALSYCAQVNNDRKENDGGLAGKDSRPNILFIVSEDNGPELGCYGAPVKTPNLDRLASEGIMFKNAYVTQAGSSPSRASFLTGLYPHQNGQVGLATWDYSMYQEDTPNLVNDLKKSGYRTGMIGKLHVLPESSFSFDWWEIRGSNFQRNKLDRYANDAYQFIKESEAPFYLQVNYPDAHNPFIPQVDGHPETVLTGNDVEALPYMGLTSDSLRQKTADYYNCIARLDEWIGVLLEKLKESGKYDNTMIVYIGDHGADILRGKRTCYEGGLKIPLIISWSGGVKNSVYQHLISTIDLYPTFMELSGNPIPSYLPGKSLMKVVKGSMKPVREFLFTEYHVHSNDNPYPQRAVRNKQYKLIYNPVADYENPGYNFTIHHFVNPDDFTDALGRAPQIVRDAYERMRKPPEYELYDLKKDPYEFNNLAGNPKYNKILNNLKKALYGWQVATKDPFLDKEIAERFFVEVMNTNNQKIEIKYHDYMDPHLVLIPR